MLTVCMCIMHRQLLIKEKLMARLTEHTFPTPDSSPSPLRLYWETLGRKNVAKTVLFDETGATLASASEEYPLHQPKNGWAEQDPDDWWRCAAECVREGVAEKITTRLAEMETARSSGTVPAPEKDDAPAAARPEVPHLLS